MSRSVQRAVAVAAISTGMFMTSAPVSGTAYAQGIPSQFLNDDRNDEAVTTRPRPEYDPTGIRVGGFTMFPSVDVSTGYDSNVFDGPSAEEDFVFAIAPRVSLVSNWSRHRVIISASNVSRFFLENDTENTTDPGGSILARIDVGGQSAIQTVVSHQRVHEARGEPEAVIAAVERVVYDRFVGGVTWQSRINRVRYSVGGDVEFLDFRDSEVNAAAPVAVFFDTAVDGVLDGTASNDDRDRIRGRLTAEIGYDFSPGYVAFVRGEVSARRFDLETDRNGQDRDSEGYEIVGGAQFELTNLLVGEIFGGYLFEGFNDDPTLQNVSGATFGAELEWYPSPLLTGRLRAQRQVSDTTLAGITAASGRLDSFVGVGVDYEARRNIIVSGDVSYEEQEFEGFPRTDDLYGAGLNSQFLINRNARASIGYLFTSRESTASGEGFRDHQVGLNLRLQR